MSELLWPNVGDFVASLDGVLGSASASLLDLVWRGYDLLAEDTATVDFSQSFDDLERDLTQLLESRIQRVMSGFEPFEIQHGPYERESRMPAPAQPPQYDLAFVLRSNGRIMWPLEAKVLPVAFLQYIQDIRSQFVTCRYGPFSSEGAMVGYLVSEDEESMFERISSALSTTLEPHPAFLVRPHRISTHDRSVPTGKEYPRSFSVHHVLMTFSRATGTQTNSPITPSDRSRM